MGFGFGLWGRRFRLGDVPLHSPGKPASNDMSVYCNHCPGHVTVAAAAAVGGSSCRSNYNRGGGALTSHGRWRDVSAKT
ncbi:hypothetical protein R69776_07196 [Paraburkholderia nemoris]|uniref:Uncharacterized protein n=1 Tax=Paraburkholderia nemoris TaxID=2793076 RepID=A0ABN7N3X4_9BURK|nr:hypothetical protein R69776_07196 [Paraburkholderia nemoris]